MPRPRRPDGKPYLAAFSRAAMVMHRTSTSVVLGGQECLEAGVIADIAATEISVERNTANGLVHGALPSRCLTEVTRSRH